MESDSPLGGPGWTQEELRRRVPEAFEYARHVAKSIPPFVSLIHSSDEDNEALHVITTQAVNDFLDLLFDALNGRGRPALRSARSLFELLIAARDVGGSSDLSSRYLDQRWIAARLESTLDLELNELPGRDRKAEEHRLRKLAREAVPRYETVIDRYGSGFTRQWHPLSLKDRADNYGLSHDYDFYRLASMVLHGSAGGLLGLRAEVGGQMVYRTGLALTLCPIALLQGLRFFDRLVRFLGARGGPGTSELRTALRGLRGTWPRYRRAVLALDRQIWPEVPVPGVMLFVAVDRAGNADWWLHDAVGGRVCRAQKPDGMSEQQSKALGETIGIAKTRAHLMVDAFFTIAVPGVYAQPQEGSRWQPDGIVFPHRIFDQASPTETERLS